MADPLAGAMGPLMDTLAARAIERAVDAGEIDPDLYYERWRDRQAYEQRLSWDEGEAADLSHRPEEPPDPQADYDSAAREQDDPLDEEEDAYLNDLADMGIEAHEYERQEP